jgi:hypothetical protein
LRSACVQRIVNAAVSLLDLDEALVSPRDAPLVSAEPVVKAGGAIMTPTYHLDGETPSQTPYLVIVNTALVVEEVFVDRESSLHWTVVVKLGLDGCNRGRVDDRARLALILQPGLTLAVTGLSANSRFTVTRRVGPASVRYNTSGGEVIPDSVHVATITAPVIEIARYGVLRRKDNFLSGNTESI